MQAKLIARLVLVSLGIALLLAGLFFDVGTAVSADLQAATPTVDRLAQPTLPSVPSQADRGAQVYWLSCLPCHGDKGQGLTDEFRAVYPPEDQYCWDSGCHGKRPYEDGFTIPTVIPAVVGYEGLSKFSNAAQLHSYISVAMPYWKPGSLTEDESWMVTAFILRESGVWNADVELNETNAADVEILPKMHQQDQVQKRSGDMVWLLIPGGIAILVILFFVLKKIQNKTTI